MAPEPQERIPYLGPLPFLRRHRDLFFGRDNEVSELLSLVISHRVLLLYAQSGAGKTSLLNAGLAPVLEEEGFEVLPLARVAGSIPKGIEPKEIPNLYVFNALMSWSEQEDADPGKLLEKSLADFLQQRERVNDEEGRARPRVVIFDQFEELFSSYQERWAERKQFFERVADMLTDDPLLRVIFAIREDYIAQLDPYAHLLPERLRTRYRLERLRVEAACQAVEGPPRDTGRTFAEGVALSLVNKLLNIRVEDAVGEIIETPGEYVEPVQLQIVCQSLWRNLPQEVTVIVDDHLERFGDVQEVLRSFYERTIETAKQQTGVSESDLRAWFTNKLITPAGTRGTVFQGKEQTEGIANSAVEVLEAQHIIRAERRSGARWYELTHDRLIEPIRKANETFQRAEEKRRAKARWLRRLAAAFGAVCIVTLATEILVSIFFTHNLTVTAVDGSVTKSPDKVSYFHGAKVTLTAVPDPNHKFDGWSGDLCDSNNPAKLVMDGDKLVIANFAPKTYNLSATSGVGGSITKIPDKAGYNRGEKVVLKVVANKGYDFTNWSGALSDSNNPATLVMDGDKQVTANFSIKTYRLDISDMDRGYVTKNPEGLTYNYGETVTLTAVPDEGYSFTNWSGDLSGDANQVTLQMDSDKSVTASFVALKANSIGMKLIATAVDGSVTKSPDKTAYNLGETVTLRAVPNKGNIFANWSGDLSDSTNPVTIHMDSDRSVTANFVALAANSIGMNLVYIPRGSFMMGGGDSAAQLARIYRANASDFANVFPQHQVRISKGFWMGQTEVTQGQYKPVMNAQPWSGKSNVREDPDNPAVCVSWDDAVEFCRKLSQKEGKTYRLPTEAEWEYTCRAGTTTRFSFGDSDISLDDYAWHKRNAFAVGEQYAHSVAQKKPNPWGLYDMHGNVWEWCSDWYNRDYYSSSPSVDPIGPSSGTERSLRGAAYGNDVYGLLSCFRWKNSPGLTVSGVGFRVVRESETETTYSLIATAVDGSVTKDPDKTGYDQDEKVTLKAVPHDGYVFTNWSGDLSDSNDTAKLVMGSDKSVTANFALRASLTPQEGVATYTGWIHKGCVAFGDQEDAISKGRITSVKVCHSPSGYIYGLQLYYGGYGGGSHGLTPDAGFGLTVQEWSVPDDQWIEKVEGQIAGYYISRLQFITNKGIRSLPFGGKPGTPFTAAYEELPLRTISGWVNLRRHPSLSRAITSMTFHFGSGSGG